MAGKDERWPCKEVQILFLCRPGCQQAMLQGDQEVGNILGTTA